MSGYSEEAASGRFAGKGLAGFLEKPFSPDAVASALRRVAAATRPRSAIRGHLPAIAEPSGPPEPLGPETRT
jgi:hypothetical protein